MTRATITPAEPNIRYNPASDSWSVREAFQVHDHARGRVLFIPKGFVCDGASIPRFCWRVVGKHELGEPAPIVHDFLYRTGGQPPVHLRAANVDPYTKAQADDLFDAIMQADGVKPWKRRVSHRAVRMFGRSSWKGAK